MRDRIARTILFGIGIVAVCAGILGILGLTRIETRASAVVVGIAAIAGGVAMMRGSRGPNPPVRKQ